MSENKLLALSFDFAVAVVQMVDGITFPKSAYMTDQVACAGTSIGRETVRQYSQTVDSIM